MALQISGKILQIGNVVSIRTKKGSLFEKRELILDCTRFDPMTGEPYENYPKIDFGGNKCGELDNFKVGDLVTVSFSLNGSKIVDSTTREERFYTSVNGYKVEPFQSNRQPQYTPEQPSEQPQQNTVEQQKDVPFPPDVDEEGNPINNDDMPF